MFPSFRKSKLLRNAKVQAYTSELQKAQLVANANVRMLTNADIQDYQQRDCWGMLRFKPPKTSN